jgi:pyruvate dehydrogenase E1 component
MGAVLPEVIAAAEALAKAGIEADVVCLTSADLIFRALQSRQGLRTGSDRILDVLFPADRVAPMVTVIDGHPHTLSFVGAIHGTPVTSLGVADFGQVGDVDDLYRYFGIDTDTIVGASWDVIEADRVRCTQ